MVESKFGTDETTRFRRGWIVGVASVLLLAAAVACHRSASPGGGKAKRPRIALIMKSLANEFFATMEAGARSHQASHADEYELVASGIKDERDVARQIGIVNEMIAGGVDAIVIAPADSKALVPTLGRAQKRGIVIVNIDNKLDAAALAESGLKIPFVGPDNRKGARAVGDYLASKLKRGDAVALIEGIPTAFNSQERRRGFEEAMKSAGLKIVAVQSGNWEAAMANQVAAGLLSEHPEIKAILCCNDSMALGALAAVKAAGRQNKVLIVGFDNISAVQDATRRGEIVATADQHADQLAVFGIEYALSILRDGVEPDDKETPVDLITAETLAGSRSRGNNGKGQ